jgi:hypothetical protein
MQFHTVYDSFDSRPQGRDYVGKHSTENPYDDYRGSFKDKTYEPDSKIIVGYAKTAEGAVWLEMQWQRVLGVVEDPQFVNRAYQTNTGFDRSGVKDTEETRTRKSKAKSGENNPNYGKPRSPEAKQKTSETLKGTRTGEDNPMYGKKRTEEAKRKTSEKCKGSEHAKLGARLQHAQRWVCTVTGYVSTPCGLTHYQKARGIDTSNRVKLEG